MNTRLIIDHIKDGVDLLSDNEYINILGDATQIGHIIRTGLSIQDKLFLRKLNNFLNAVDLNNAEREAYSIKLSSDPKLQEKTGLAILELISKADSEVKSAHIGVIFSDYVRNGYDGCLFFRYTQAVNALYADEIDYFLSTAEEYIDETSDAIEHLISVGIYTRTYGSIGFGTSISLQRKPALTETGNAIFTILRECSKKSEI
jgi:hypothetical protein